MTYTVFLCITLHIASQKHNTMFAFVIGEITNNKHYSRRNTQRLPVMAASTLLRLLKPRLVYLCEHLGSIMQISSHRDVDMWGMFE